MHTNASFSVWLAISLGALLHTTGCLKSSTDEVVVYTALDREFSEPIFDKFADDTGIVVLAKYDTESTKTVGLANALIAEADRPRCDVFWNNEILNTLRLENRGLLASFEPKRANDIPDKYRSPAGHWFGFAARARVLIVNTQLVAESEYPKSVLDMTDPMWKDKFAIAKPLFGTTATHAAMIFASETTEDAKQFWQTVLENAQVLSGNKQVARAVASGQALWGLTDTDDAIIELDNGHPVSIIFPDQSTTDSGSPQFGTPLIPNTLAIVANCPNRSNAERLVDYLLSPEVEAKLAQDRSAQIPLLKSTHVKSRLSMPAELRDLDVDFNEAAKKWDEAAAFLRAKYID